MQQMIETTNTKSEKSVAYDDRPSDLEVVREVLGGRLDAYETLVRRNNQRLFRVCIAMLRVEAEAEDAMQEVYVIAFSKLDQFAGRSEFSSWLTRIAINECSRRLRQRGRWTWLDEDRFFNRREEELPKAPWQSTPRRGPENDALSGELKAVLRTALDNLHESYRVVFLLRHVEALSTEQTAASLGITPDNVKARLMRARRALRRDLSQRLDLAASDLYGFLGARCDRMVARVLERLRALVS